MFSAFSAPLSRVLLFNPPRAGGWAFLRPLPQVFRRYLKNGGAQRRQNPGEGSKTLEGVTSPLPARARVNFGRREFLYLGGKDA